MRNPLRRQQHGAFQLFQWKSIAKATQTGYEKQCDRNQRQQRDQRFESRTPALPWILRKSLNCRTLRLEGLSSHTMLPFCN